MAFDSFRRGVVKLVLAESEDPDVQRILFGKHNVALAVRMRGRHGITILEVIVVISVVALLATLILPAVQAAREVSRRANCTSNLHQLGTAIADYQGIHEQFPIDDCNIPHGPTCWSQFVELLPHIGKQNIFNSINFDMGIDQIDPSSTYTMENNGALLSSVSLLLCPSDSSEAGTNYRFCAGSLPSATDGDGAFSWHRTDSGIVRVKPALVTDGESNTAAMSEKLVAPGPEWSRRHSFWYSGYHDVMGYPSGGRNSIAPDEMMEVCQLTPDDPLSWHECVGHSWSQRWYAYVLYNHVAPPNSNIPDCTPWGASPNTTLDQSRTSPTEGMFTARSWHPGGVNVLFLDGHVRFISDSVDLAVWRGMASIDGGELF